MARKTGEAKVSPPDIKTAFVISPIGALGSETRKHSDQLYNHIIEPIVSAAGYEVTRADKLGQPGVITLQVLRHLLDDDLVIADLTDHNPNVFYELAVRHVIQKPCIQLIRDGEDIPFDVAGIRTIYFDLQDLDRYVQAKQELQEQLESLVSKTAAESPFTAIFNVDALRQKPDDESQERATVLQALSNLQADVRHLMRQGSAEVNPVLHGLMGPTSDQRHRLRNAIDERNGLIQALRMQRAASTDEQQSADLLERIKDTRREINNLDRELASLGG